MHYKFILPFFCLPCGNKVLFSCSSFITSWMDGSTVHFFCEHAPAVRISPPVTKASLFFCFIPSKKGEENVKENIIFYNLRLRPSHFDQF